MTTITASGLASTLWRRIARRIEARMLQMAITGYDRDLESLHHDAANNRAARRVIQYEQMRRKARLAELQR